MKFKITSVLTLSIAGLFASGAAYSYDCREGNARITPFTKAKLDQEKTAHCPGDNGSCYENAKQYAALADEFMQSYAGKCREVVQALVSDVGGQNDAAEKDKSNLQKMKSGQESLSRIAESTVSKLNSKMRASFSDGASATVIQLQPEVATQANKVKEKVLATDSTFEPSDVTGHTPYLHKLRSNSFGTKLRQALLQVKTDSDLKIVDINSQIARLDNPGGNPGGGDKKEGGGFLSSLNPNTLMGLGAAAMGMMAAMKKPSDATPETPLPTVTGPAPIPATSLVSKDGNGANHVNASVAPPKTETATVPSSSGGSGYGSSQSDVTSRSAGSMPSTGSGGSKSPSSEGGGGSLSAGSSSEPANREPAAVMPMKPYEDPAGMSFAGGAGGGANFGGSSSSSATSTDQPATPPEDPLRQTLQEMAAAVDNAQNQTNSQNEEVAGENGDGLFLRVNKAISRSLKKGLVISGLSAKIK